MNDVGEWAAKLLLTPFLFLKDRPVLYRGERFTLVGYGVFAVLDALAVFAVTLLYLRLRGHGPTAELALLFPLVALGTWAGSRLMHLAALGRKLLRQPAKYLAETGFYVQGGIVGAVVSSALLSPLAGVDVIVLWDGLAWGALLGLFFGRLGCFNYGCCYGRPTKKGGVCYHNPQVKMLRMHPELRGVHVHPSQLYTALSHLALFALVTVTLALATLPNGSLSVLFLLYHGLSRLIIERFRGDIFFSEGRNWATFRTAGIFVISGGAMLALGDRLLPSFGATPGESRLLGPAAFAALSVEPTLIVSALVLASVVFLGFGLHGRDLGTFPRITFPAFRHRTGQPALDPPGAQR